MSDIFEATVVCPECNEMAEKGFVVKEGFRIRTWHCPRCNKRWFHPADQKEYEDFNKLKQKEFRVKLRMVGNSYAISIPREIIQFEEEFLQSISERRLGAKRLYMNMRAAMEREFERIVKLCLEEPGKLSLFFNIDDETLRKERLKKKLIEEDQEHTSIGMKTAINKSYRKVDHSSLIPPQNMKDECDKQEKQKKSRRVEIKNG